MKPDIEKENKAQDEYDSKSKSGQKKWQEDFLKKLTSCWEQISNFFANLSCKDCFTFKGKKRDLSSLSEITSVDEGSKINLDEIISKSPSQLNLFEQKRRAENIGPIAPLPRAKRNKITVEDLQEVIEKREDKEKILSKKENFKSLSGIKEPDVVIGSIENLEQVERESREHKEKSLQDLDVIVAT